MGTTRDGEQTVALTDTDAAQTTDGVTDPVRAQTVLETGLTVEEAIAEYDGMRDGAIDGFFWSGGLPTAAVTDLLSTNGGDVSFLDVTPVLADLQEINPVYEDGVIPADAYGLDEDVPTIIVPNVLLVRDDISQSDACAITELIWSSVDELATVHPAAAELDPATALETGPIPLAPGAQQALEALAGDAGGAGASSEAATSDAPDTTDG